MAKISKMEDHIEKEKNRRDYYLCAVYKWDISRGETGCLWEGDCSARGQRQKRPVNIYHFENHRSIAYYYTQTIPMSIGILFLKYYF